jgi:hypothetical protein
VFGHESGPDILSPIFYEQQDDMGAGGKQRVKDIDPASLAWQRP